MTKTFFHLKNLYQRFKSFPSFGSLLPAVVKFHAIRFFAFINFILHFLPTSFVCKDYVNKVSALNDTVCKTIQEHLGLVLTQTNLRTHTHILRRPTIKHCSLATLIGLCIHVKLQRNLPTTSKISVFIKEGSHNTEKEGWWFRSLAAAA